MTVYEKVEKYIMDNYLEVDKQESLPPIRELAGRLGCSRNSVIKAYEKLEEKHFIYSIPQSGFYPVNKQVTKRILDDVIDLRTANPDGRALPYQSFVHCISRTVEDKKQELFQYPDVQGYRLFRESLVKLFEDRCVYTNIESICVTNGIEQALSILFSMKPEKGTVLFEIPGYLEAIKIAELYGWKITYITRTEEGIDLQELEEIFRQEQIVYFYLMPRFQNPLGSCLSEMQKKKIASLAEKYKVYLIEDDYLGELEIKQNRLPLFYYASPENRIYLTGFSKSFMPGLRIGAACLPEKLKEEFLYCKKITDLGTCMLEQAALQMFLENGMYQKHQKKIRKVYHEKMSYCKNFFKNMVTEKGIIVSASETGYYLFIRLSKDSNEHRADILRKLLEDKRVYITTGASYYNHQQNVQAIRICISNCEMEQLKLGLNIIQQLL